MGTLASMSTRLHSLLLYCKDGLKQTPEHTADRKANCIHHLARDSGERDVLVCLSRVASQGLGILIFEMGLLIELWCVYG